MSRAAILNNPSRPTVTAPVKVTSHYRGDWGSTENLRARRKGQKDLFPEMDWKRNPELYPELTAQLKKDIRAAMRKVRDDVAKTDKQAAFYINRKLEHLKDSASLETFLSNAEDTALIASKVTVKNPINFQIAKKGEFVFARIKNADVKALARKFGTAQRDGRVKFNSPNYQKFLTQLDKNFELRANPAIPILELRIGHYGANLINTNLELKGQGIKLFNDGKDHARGLKTYKVSDKALEKLEQKYTIVYKNPAEPNALHPVQVKTYYRQEPASLHLLARRKGQKDLFESMDWKRNPSANFLQSLLVRHSGDKTIITTPTGERITLEGTLTRAEALKQASRELIKSNPAFETAADAEAAAEFLENMIDALDVENDGDLDAGDVAEFRDFEQNLSGEEDHLLNLYAGDDENEGVTFETFDTGDDQDDDYLSELFGATGDGAECQEIEAAEVSDAEGERDGVIISETPEGEYVVAWIDDEGGEQIQVEHPENLLFIGEPGEQIESNPPKWIVSGFKISTGKRVFIKLDSEQHAKRKLLKLQKTGNFENLRIRPTKDYPDAREVRENGLLSGWNNRRKAGREYKKELRLQAQIEKTRKRRADFEGKAKQNPDAISTFANLAVGLASSLAIGKEIKNAAKRRKNATAAQQTPKTVRKNPGVNFEMFHGRPSSRKTEAKGSYLNPRNLEFIGELVEIKLVGTAEPISFARMGRYPFMLCSDQDGQLFIVNGRISHPDSSLSKNQLSSFGAIDFVTYRAHKAHLGDTEHKFYRHKFGEEGGERPELCADHLGYPVINGGTYRIEPDFDGVHSSGIRD
jgi:hypothetical protein